MFRIDSNQSIKMSKGDTVYFPLFLNKGTLLTPVRYEFTPIIIEVSEDSSESTVPAEDITIYQPTWIAKVGTTSGTFLFSYATGKWQLDGTDVNLIDYGITVTGTILTSSFFTVKYTHPDDNEKVQFYVLPVNNRTSEPILVKEYYANGTTISQRNNGTITTVTTTGNANVNDNGDMVIRLEEDDTSFIPEGQYRYQVKAKLKDTKDVSGYSINTVTNRLPFYIVDDDYSSNFNYR